ncbi:MAG: CHAP domain-containing protein [Chloroflexota bacterium]
MALALLAAPASATPSASEHPRPSTNVAGVTRLCGPAEDYRCTGAGYAGQNDGWPGVLYGRGHASSNRYGLHNCTLYAAYRLWKNGVSNPGWWGNANEWDSKAASITNQAPAVGSIAQWNGGKAGHVAYVEAVTSLYIEITDDNFKFESFPGNYTDRWRIARNSAAMPDNFIHFKDVGAKWYERNYNSSGPSASSFVYGRPGDWPLVGNWDGVGGDTVGVFRGGTWYLRNSNSGGNAKIKFSYGRSTDIPIVGNWDGVGGDTIGVFRKGTWYLRNYNSSGPSFTSFSYGRSTDIPVVGDWNGDGKDTIGVFRNGTWYLRNSNSSGPANITFSYGRSTDIPIVGDWDGHVGDTVGVFRSGKWYERNYNSSGPSSASFRYGRSTDWPIVGDWDGHIGDTVGVFR